MNLNLWQGMPAHAQSAPSVPSLRASAPEIDVGPPGAGPGAAPMPVRVGGGMQDWVPPAAVPVERRGRASFSGQAVTVCISGPPGVGAGPAAREPERRSMDRTSRRPGQVMASGDRAVTLQRHQAPMNIEGHLRAAAAAALTGQAWGPALPADSSNALYGASQAGINNTKAAHPEGRRSFSDGGASARSLPASLAGEDPRGLHSALSNAVENTSLVMPGQSNVPSTVSRLFETEELRREVEMLRVQTVELRAALESRDHEIARLSRRLRDAEVVSATPALGTVANARGADSAAQAVVGPFLGTESSVTPVLDVGEWDRRASVDSYDSGLFSSMRLTEQNAPLTPSSSFQLPRPPPVLLDTVTAQLPGSNPHGVNGRISRPSISGDIMDVRDHDDDRREILHLRERVRIVEEALQLMRDEARARVPSVEAADISYVRLLGRGSFAEVCQPCLSGFIIV